MTWVCRRGEIDHGRRRVRCGLAGRLPKPARVVRGDPQFLAMSLADRGSRPMPVRGLTVVETPRSGLVPTPAVAYFATAYKREPPSTDVGRFLRRSRRITFGPTLD